MNRRVLFGDLHVHTSNSADAFMFNVRATPDDAYRYAKGEVLVHASGFPIQLRGGALDFSAVTDHGELLGILPAMANSNTELSKLEIATRLRNTDRRISISAFREILDRASLPGKLPAVRDLQVIRSAWQSTVEAAERHNQPGKFTTFVGYEYSSAPQNQNLHRNVIFASGQVPRLPFSALDSENPEHLWRWLDRLRAEGIDGLAIPHNSNVSNGLMFDRHTWEGQPLDATYAELRMRNEPLVEVSQVKGTSETHPLLSPNDEWASFELYDNLIASNTIAKTSGGFAREAYSFGLMLQDTRGFNPYKFGLIGSSDTHNAGSPVEESRFFGKAGTLDGTAMRRGAIPSSENPTFGASDAKTTFRQWSAAGLMGVWAEENTRQSLFGAMRRKEAFATSGPRIQLRFFAGFGFNQAMLSNPNMVAQAYELGVSMGAELSGSGGQVPSFLVWATQDINSARLQRLQVIKGWRSQGKDRQQVFDVACANGLKPDPANFRCPAMHDSVDMQSCTPSSTDGAVELRVLWKDPLFSPDELAYYYVRVLENSSCRWSTWDALRAGVAPMPGIDATIQERAWSSPIWYQPGKPAVGD